MEKGKDNRKVKLREEVGLLEGTAITIGSIIGSGIFISPKGVVENSGSVGLSLIIWLLCGLQATLGALCYAELGTSLQGSGGDYHYLNVAFGGTLAFSFLWVSNLIFLPATNAILSLTFSRYVFAAFFPEGCVIPQYGIQLMAICTICLLTWLNIASVKATTKIQNVFMFGKIGALLIIICTGLFSLVKGNTSNYENVWEHTNPNVGKLALASYSGIFAYSGWNTLNYITEELKNPIKNLPRAIYISMPIVTLVYVLTNVAYFVVLSPEEMHISNAIAVTFGKKTLGCMQFLMPVCVAISSFGGLSVHIMTASRILFVGARNGHFPQLLSLIQLEHLSPASSLIFMGILSVFYVSIPDLFVLINFSSFVFSLFLLIVVVALLYLRWTQPTLIRPIKVHIMIPICFLVICIFVVIMPVLVRPYEVLIGLGITLTSFPVYALFFIVKWEPKWLLQSMHAATVFVQKLLVASPQDMEVK